MARAPRMGPGYHRDAFVSPLWHPSVFSDQGLCYNVAKVSDRLPDRRACPVGQVESMQKTLKRAHLMTSARSQGGHIGWKPVGEKQLNLVRSTPDRVVTPAVLRGFGSSLEVGSGVFDGIHVEKTLVGFGGPGVLAVAPTHRTTSSTISSLGTRHYGGRQRSRHT
jgi:hypothetical protein